MEPRGVGNNGVAKPLSSYRDNGFRCGALKWDIRKYKPHSQAKDRIPV